MHKHNMFPRCSPPKFSNPCSWRHDAGDRLSKTVCSLLVSASIKTADVVVNLQSIIQSISIHPISLMSSKIWTNTNLHLDIDVFQGQGENWGTPPGSRKSSKCKVRVPRRPSTSASELINWSLVNRYNSIIHDTFSNCNLLRNGFCVGSCWTNAGDPIFTSMTIGQFPQPYFSQLPCVITILTPHLGAYESRSICNQLLYT